MESFTGNQRKLEETKEDWKKSKSKSVDKIVGFLQRKQGGRYHEQYPWKIIILIYQVISE